MSQLGPAPIALPHEVPHGPERSRLQLQQQLRYLELCLALLRRNHAEHERRLEQEIEAVSETLASAEGA